MHFLSALVVALFLAVPAKADLQCMARFPGGFWDVLSTTGAEMTATRCVSYLSYPLSTPPQNYRLRVGPVKNSQQTTCQWTWAPSASLRELPPDAPESIICNLFPAPPPPGFY